MAVCKEMVRNTKGMRKLGIPTVTDRIIQQAIAQKLMLIYEPLFAEGCYGCRPNRSAKDAIPKVKEYAEQGYIYAVSLDLSKYFDTLSHEILISLLRKEVKDERVVQMIKRGNGERCSHGNRGGFTTGRLMTSSA